MSTCTDPLGRMLNLIDGKYKPLIIWGLSVNSRGFNEIRSFIPHATAHAISDQLKELVDDGLVTRRVISKSPLRVEYSLTTIGRSLVPVLDAMGEWGAAYQDMEREKALSGPSRSPE